MVIRGWFLQNLVTLTRIDEQAIDVADLSSHTVSPAKADSLKRLRNDIHTHHATPGNFLTFLLIDKYTEIWQITAYDQTRVDECQIACALERYRLAHGEYPQTLDSLFPQFIDTIPHDIIGGQPLHYRQTINGKFLLYSVGWNQKDDGGQESKKNENDSIDYTNGDWVWGN